MYKYVLCISFIDVCKCRANARLMNICVTYLCINFLYHNPYHSLFIQHQNQNKILEFPFFHFLAPLTIADVNIFNYSENRQNVVFFIIAHEILIVVYSIFTCHKFLLDFLGPR